MPDQLNRDELLKAAVHVLRSYQYGNAATELAKDMADKLEACMVSALSSPAAPAQQEKDGERSDAERLDFIIENETSWYPGYYNGSWQKDLARGTLCYGEGRKEAEGATMREAIDAAIQQTTADTVQGGKS